MGFKRDAALRTHLRMPGSFDLFGMTVPPAQPTAVAAEPFCLAVRFAADRLSAHGADIVRG